MFLSLAAWETQRLTHRKWLLCRNFPVCSSEELFLNGVYLAALGTRKTVLLKERIIMKGAFNWTAVEADLEVALYGAGSTRWGGGEAGV